MKKISMTLTSTPIRAKTRTLMWKPKPPTGPDPIKPDQYFSSGGAEYNSEGARACGYLCLPVLQELWGRKLDEVVMSYVHSLRPSIVRIVDQCANLDSRVWRVTIWTKKVQRIRFVTRIEQEVKVLLPEGVAHGEALNLARRYGISSKQVKWHRNATGYTTVYAGLGGGTWKNTPGGSVEWKFKPESPAAKLWLKE